MKARLPPVMNKKKHSTAGKERNRRQKKIKPEAEGSS